MVLKRLAVCRRYEDFGALSAAFQKAIAECQHKPFLLRILKNRFEMLSLFN